MTSAVSGLSAALYRDEPLYYVVTGALGSNRDICFVSKNVAVPGIEILVAGNNTALTVSVAGSDVSVHSATNGSGVATSTAAQIVAAVNANVSAFALFAARLPPGSTGAGVTGAFTHAHPSEGVAFTALSLVDSGDHLTYQAAAGSRYWDDGKALTVKVDGSTVTSGFTVNFLKGSVTFATSQVGSAITADGTKRSILAFQKVVNLYDCKIKIDGKDIDTTSGEDDGWGSSIVGSRSWSMTAGAFYYDGSIPLTALAVKYLWKFYSVLATTPFALGKGAIQSMTDILANPNDAQKQTVTVKGAGELYIE
jgi:hypothetical protein